MKFLLILLLTISSAFAENIVLSARNTVSLNSEVSSESVAQLQFKLLNMSKKLKSTEPIFLVLNTPGGSISAGNALIETIKSLPNPVHTISIFAASMGYQIVQNSGTRYILASGTLMSHLGAVSGLSGEVNGNLESLVAYLRDVTGQLDEVAAKRVGITLEAYQSLIKKEYWGYGAKAVKDNHADSVVTASCDNTLSGTYKEEVRVFIFTAEVTFSNCPLITDPLDVKVGIPSQKAQVYNFYKNMTKKVVYKW